jgi:hypothetical protein
MVWSRLKVRLGNEVANEVLRTLYIVWLKSTHASTCNQRESMRHGRWPEGRLDRTQLNTSPTSVRTTIASVAENE